MALPGLVVGAAQGTDLLAMGAILADATGGHVRVDQALAACRRHLDLTLVARQDGRPVGCISCWQDEMLGVIGAHAVLRSHQRLGIGSRLVVDLLPVARREGLRLVEVFLSGETVPARRLYERQGFREVAPSAGPGFVLYERRLGGPT